MRTLYHSPLDPLCRAVRILLGEKRLPFALKAESAWERQESFLALNPAGAVPVLVDEDGTSIPGARVIAEYLDEVYAEPPLIGATPADRAETRRLADWFDGKFLREVSAGLIEEKITRRLAQHGEPNAAAIRSAHGNIHYHLDYIAWLCDRRRWLAGDDFTLADVAAAAHISAVDYLGDVPWAEHAGAKDWYARVKSRPSLRPILADRIHGATPAPHYADPDF